MAVPSRERDNRLPRRVVPFVIADSLAVEVLLGTSFIDVHIERIGIDKQCLDLRRVRGVAIVDAKGVASNHGETRTKLLRRTLNDNGRVTDAQPIRPPEWISIPAMWQLGVSFITKGLGLVFLDPKPSLPHRHGVRLTNGSPMYFPTIRLKSSLRTSRERHGRFLRILSFGMQSGTLSLFLRQIDRSLMKWAEFSTSRQSRRHTQPMKSLTTKWHRAVQQNIAVLRGRRSRTTSNLM